MGKPSHEDAQLILRLYDLRREETMRKARKWFFAFPYPTTVEEFLQIAPPGSDEHAYYRMVATYWDMAASFVVSGVLSEELFFISNNQELLFVWIKLRHLIPGLRQISKNNYQFKSLEQVASNYYEWMSSHSPEAPATLEARAKATPYKK